ncbi:hypothetical protein [Sabulicella rubraurantiaca]|uniref:hypothetical protein n=1 Tax=Sabulicella rubraurantiaca TaxID=2811429 RepID=UPI001A95952C|nr:hypothetical protein [Sabulicella rubraurantiaca]
MRRIMNLRAVLAICLLSGLLAGCAGARDTPGRALSDRLCAPRTAAPWTPEEQAPFLPRAEFDRVATRMERLGLSRRGVEVAEVIGALPALERLEAARGEDSRFRARQAVVNRVLLASLDVAGLMAELDCEEERSDQLRERLQRVEARRARRLNLASIMIGAATAVATGGLSLAGAGTAGDIVGIVGGSAGAATAGSVLFGAPSGEFRTERNLLREVWEPPPRPAFIPPAAWRHLTRPGDDGRSIAERLVAEWRADERLSGPQREARMRLLLGGGGAYTVEELELREGSLDLLEASVALMNQDLRLLLGELLARN